MAKREYAKRDGKKGVCKCVHLFPSVGDNFNWLIEDLIWCRLIIQDAICHAVRFRCSSMTVPSLPNLPEELMSLFLLSLNYKQDQFLKVLWRTLIEISEICIASDRHNLGKSSLAATWGVWQTVCAGLWAWMTPWRWPWATFLQSIVFVFRAEIKPIQEMT